MDHIAYRKELIRLMAFNPQINKLSYYAIFSAWLALYYPERELAQNKYDQDYAVNQGIVYG